MYKPFPLFLIAAAFSLSVSAQNAPNSLSVENALEDRASFTNGGGIGTGSMLSFHGEGTDTKGRRMLLADWAGGIVVLSNDSILQSSQVVYNYDKISHDLYYSMDRQTTRQADRAKIKGFSLPTSEGTWKFVRLDNVIHDVFFREFVPYDSTHYGFYSLTITTFKKADYRSDGLVETGNNYNEYVDKAQYYLIPPGGKEFYPIEFSKKSLRAALPAQKGKIDAFISTHKNDDIDESFVTALVNSINQP